MSPKERNRFEPEEGPLGDREVQRDAQDVNAKIRRINDEDLFELERDPRFRRWFGRWSETLLMMDLRTSNGGDLQHFMGRRSLVLDMITEMDNKVPGFWFRVLQIRRALDSELRPTPRSVEDV